MKPSKSQTTTSQSDINFRSLTKQEKKAKKAFMKYHPMENNMSFKVDEGYMKRFEAIFGAKTK